MNKSKKGLRSDGSVGLKSPWYGKCNKCGFEKGVFHSLQFDDSLFNGTFDVQINRMNDGVSFNLTSNMDRINIDLDALNFEDAEKESKEKLIKYFTEIINAIKESN